MDKIEEIKQKTEKLLEYCHAYYDLDAPLISDAEYDKLYDELYNLEEEAGFHLVNSPTRKVQGEVLPFLTKVHHSVPMLSADKSTSIEDVKKFIGNRPVVASYKLDGGTVVIKYQNGQFVQALSRGSGTDGEDITHTAKMIKNLPITIPYKGYLEIRGEAVIPWKYYNEMNVDGAMGHPRNVAMGSLRQLDASVTSQRNIYFYAFTLVNWEEVGVDSKFQSLKFLHDNGFDVVPHVLLPTYGTLEKAIAYLNREEYGVPTDGWCFEYNDLEYGESLGSTEHHDRRLFALKPEVEGYETTFRGVEFNTCRTGVVSMTAIFDSVEIGNTTVSKATLHNVDFFRGLELGIGDTITVTKFNEIIPGIMENETRSGTYKLIHNCPSCGEPLMIKNTGTANVLYCQNKDCPSRKVAEFTHFVSKAGMDIKGLSESTLELLISNGIVNDFVDIYRLSDKKVQLLKLPRMGRKSVKNLLDNIEKSRNVSLDHFITALGIPNIGSSAAKAIAEYCHGDFNEFTNAFVTRFDWSILKDFGDIMSMSIDEYLRENFNEVVELAHEMNFIVEEKKTVSDSIFKGKNICITGSLEVFKNRNELVSAIEAVGGHVVSSVTAKTDYLLTNNANSGSSKAVKANELGIAIISEREFMDMCGDE